MQLILHGYCAVPCGPAILGGISVPALKVFIFVIMLLLYVVFVKVFMRICCGISCVGRACGYP